MVRTSRYDLSSENKIVCYVDDIILKEILGGRYKEKVYVEANNMAGGILISWKESTFGDDKPQDHKLWMICGDFNMVL
jgi:hypothetical protein